jgi:N6-adenosine-specific RNA methylase IME4
VLFGVRGDLKTRSDSIPTHFEAPLGPHSAKPAKFYEIVTQASYLPAGEAFQRTPRDGFLNVFEERSTPNTAAGAPASDLPIEPPVQDKEDLVADTGLRAGGGND